MIKKYISLLLIALLFCAVVSVGCGGGSDNDSSEPEQTENLTDDTGEYDPNEEARGNSEEPTDLSKITANYTAKNGETLTGTLSANVKISVADGATVTLKNVTINGVHEWSYRWAGLTCEGDATLILAGTNSVKGFYRLHSGIYVPGGKTLTIKGIGSLNASSNGRAAGIGAGYDSNCGNIVIEGGSITATGGDYGAGIGAGDAPCGNITITSGYITAAGGDYAAGIGVGELGNCGNIMIDGGTITATGGEDAAGIGGGHYGNCGDIIITKNVTKVTAIKDNHAEYSIGPGSDSKCGQITAGDKVGPFSDSPFIYP